MELGKDIEDSVIEKKIEDQKPEQCALLIYTVSNLKLMGLPRILIADLSCDDNQER